MVTVGTDPLDDDELLLQYTASRSEEAFTELVRRHLVVVHSAAFRQTGGDAAAAADIAQSVFIELARQAVDLRRHPALVGWLYTTTHRIAARHVRTEDRRKRREEEAHRMQELQRPAGPDPDWDQLAPVLDSAMNELGELDRLALLWRHFERRPFSEVGDRLGLNENAARMRVERALDKLRARLMTRGIHSTSGALALALGGLSVVATPPHLVASISSAALAATPLTLTTVGLLTLMTSTPIKITGIALACGIVATLLFIRQGAAHRQREADLVSELDRTTADLQSTRETLRQAEEERAQRASSTEELLRLRGELAALRRAAGSPVKSPETNAVDQPPPPGRTPSARIQARIPAGSTLLTDKWTTSAGRVAFALVTPTSVGTNPAEPQVELVTRVFEGTEDRIEALGEALGGKVLVSEDQRRTLALAKGLPYRTPTQSVALFTADQLQPFLAHLESTEGVVQSATPQVSTASGRQARIVMHGDSQDDPFNGLKLDFVPTLTEQGDVDLVMLVDMEGRTPQP